MAGSHAREEERMNGSELAALLIVGPPAFAAGFLLAWAMVMGVGRQ